MDDNFQITPYRPLDERNPFPSPNTISPASSTSRAAETAAIERNIGRLVIVLLVVAVVAGGPLILRQFVYQATYGKLKAGHDVATGALADLRPRLYDFELASRMVAKKVEPSVVSIYRPAGFGQEGQGSGVIIDHDGYIVTNYHVIKDAPAIQVQLIDGRRTAATVVGFDSETDLAILRINLPNLIPAEWGDSEKLEVGDLVWAVGSPFGLESTLTFGIVSAKSRHGAQLDTGWFQEFLQTDAAVNPGNSGGPLVNIEGQVIGINSAIVGPSFQGVSFAIPSRLAHEKYDELRKNGEVERAWLGVQPVEVPEIVRTRLGLEQGKGVYVLHVEPRSPADQSGVHVGDVILKWNDHQATDPRLLSQTIAGTKIGSLAKVLVAHSGDEVGNGEQFELDVNVGRRPHNIIPRRPPR